MSGTDIPTGPGSSDDVPGPDDETKAPHKPVPEMSVRERVEEAGEVTDDLFRRCGGMIRFADAIGRHYLKVRHIGEEFGPMAMKWNSGGVIAETMMHSATNGKNTDAAIAKCRELLEGLNIQYDSVSSGALQIGEICGSNAHLTAILLTEHLRYIHRSHQIELLPLQPDAREDIHGVFAALPMWQDNAERFKNRLLSVVGVDYAANLNRWIAMTRIEAAKVLASLPRETALPKLSSEERLIVEALCKAGKRLTQPKLCDAAGLKPSGSRFALLANMAERGVIRSSSKGYGLPEWEDR